MTAHNDGYSAGIRGSSRRPPWLRWRLSGRFTSSAPQGLDHGQDYGLGGWGCGRVHGVAGEACSGLGFGCSLVLVVVRVGCAGCGGGGAVGWWRVVDGIGCGFADGVVVRADHTVPTVRHARRFDNIGPRATPLGPDETMWWRCGGRTGTARSQPVQPACRLAWWSSTRRRRRS